MTIPPAELFEYTVTVRELADLCVEYIEENDRENENTRTCAIVAFGLGGFMAKVTRFVNDRRAIEEASRSKPC